MLHIPIEHADGVYKLYLEFSWAWLSSQDQTSLKYIHNSTVHDEALAMCFTRLNLLTNSREKRWVVLLSWARRVQSFFAKLLLSKRIFWWINNFPLPQYGFYNRPFQHAKCPSDHLICNCNRWGACFFGMGSEANLWVDTLNYRGYGCY